jgi:phosphoribosylanthranilate isomerase
MACIQVKICGISNVDDARAAVELGVDALGLNFYPPSPRCIDRATALAILDVVPPSIQAIGVFANEPLDRIASFLKDLPRLHAVQWHGQDHPVPVAALPALIPAFNVRDRESLTAIERYLERCRLGPGLPQAVLVDAYAVDLYGGTGHTAPWELLAAFRPGVPLLLAGGLTPDNVAEAIRRVRPNGVDVASGVEIAQGKKSREKMRAFLERARQSASSAPEA